MADTWSKRTRTHKKIASLAADQERNNLLAQIQDLYTAQEILAEENETSWLSGTVNSVRNKRSWRNKAASTWSTRGAKLSKLPS